MTLINDWMMNILHLREFIKIVDNTDRPMRTATTATHMKPQKPHNKSRARVVHS